MSPVDLATASLNADTALMSAFAGTWDSTMCKRSGSRRPALNWMKRSVLMASNWFSGAICWILAKKNRYAPQAWCTFTASLKLTGFLSCCGWLSWSITSLCKYKFTWPTDECPFYSKPGATYFSISKPFGWKTKANCVSTQVAKVESCTKFVQGSAQLSARPNPLVQPVEKVPFPITSWLRNFAIPRVVTNFSNSAQTLWDTSLESANKASLSALPMLNALAIPAALLQSSHRSQVEKHRPAYRVTCPIHCTRLHQTNFQSCIWDSVDIIPPFRRTFTWRSRLKQWGALRVALALIWAPAGDWQMGANINFTDSKKVKSTRADPWTSEI